MFNPDLSNQHFRLAAELINNTSRNIFLTGKAGSGKTTFLKYIREATHKNCAVVAPTGVAAINAGGVTMHSFFQLPFEPFVPVRGSLHSNTANQNNLFGKLQLNRVKREVMQELELLIIDEVSMVRCDQLDAIDTILRGVRRRYQAPFGGVQILFIGDMYQLPPVIKDEEWMILKEYYDGPFFFHSKAVEHNHPLYIELKKIYRQKDQQFINLLNNIRNNEVDEINFELLHSRYIPSFKPKTEEKFITITTHNYKADAINQEELRILNGPEFSFKGDIVGDFPDHMLPTDLNLILKKDAQVMFIKNDTGEFRKYYNGKLATIISVTKDEIFVKMNEEGTELKIEKEEWGNVRYSLNKETGGIKEETLGSFKQYPIRLAWAITIHKSQGLTFENVIIDAGQSFAAGQVYVALSRCTTLEGMVLLSKISPRVIGTDPRIIDFANRESEENELEEILDRERKEYHKEKLIETFNFQKFVDLFTDYIEVLAEKSIPEKDKVNEMAGRILISAKNQMDVAEKFKQSLPQILENHEIENSGQLQERISKAIHWFGKQTHDEILNPLLDHFVQIQHAARIRKYRQYLSDLLTAIELHLKKIFAVHYGEIKFNEDASTFQKYIPVKTVAVKIDKKKPEKGSSHRESLLLFKEGNSIDEIARLRNLAISTIQLHLISFIPKGEIKLEEIMEEKKIKLITSVIEANPSALSSELKIILGDDFSYAEIRAVIVSLTTSAQ